MYPTNVSRLKLIVACPLQFLYVKDTEKDKTKKSLRESEKVGWLVLVKQYLQSWR